MNSWEQRLAQTDLRVPELAGWYQDFKHDEGLWAAVRHLLVDGSRPAQINAAWLLMQRSREGGYLDEALVRAAAESPCDAPWQTRLNVCQVFARTTCPASLLETLLPSLLDAARDLCPFVRAWALSALHRVAQEHPATADEVNPVIAAARHDPAKSVQARLRQLGYAAPRRPPSARAKARPHRKVSSRRGLGR